MCMYHSIYHVYCNGEVCKRRKIKKWGVLICSGRGGVEKIKKLIRFSFPLGNKEQYL